MDHLDVSVVNNQIFPPLTSGFTDTENIIREHTIKVSLQENTVSNKGPSERRTQ